MTQPAEIDHCAGELGEIRAALRRGDRAGAQRHALHLEREARRLRAVLERRPPLSERMIDLPAIVAAYEDATEDHA